MAADKLSISTTLPLPNSDINIPQLGFGVYLSPQPTCIASCTTALKAGYRHIDTAQYYENEAQVGEAVRQSGLPRSEVFITTKMLFSTGTLESDYEAVLQSVKKIDGEDGYVDLFLIHTSRCPGTRGRASIWGALERLHKEGRAKAIGVSNWGVGHIEEMKSYSTKVEVWPPMVNQIELHPWSQQRETVAYCQKNGIVVEAYCPLVRNEKAKDPTLNKIADARKKSTAQVLIRYCLQKGWVPLPKSDTPSRIEQNADVFDFELTKEEMNTLDALDQGAKGAIVEAVDNSPMKAVSEN